MTAASGRCPACDGVGWVEKDTPKGRVASRCDCFGKDQPQSKYRSLGIPPRFAGASFDTFSAGRHSEDPHRYNANTAAFVKARRFADDFPVGRSRGLLFHGGRPADQTHLAVATLKCFADKGFSGKYWDYYQLMLTLRKRNDPVTSVAAVGEAAARQVAQVDILLLDSLGNHRPTDWVLDTICAIVRHRYMNEKCLLATTGLPLETASPYEEHDGFQHMRVPNPVHDSLAERIGPESLTCVLDHCNPVSMAVARPPQGALKRSAPTL